AESEGSIAHPVLMRSFALMDSGIVVGKIEIYRSLRPLLMRTVLIALIMLPLGILAFLTLRLLPIRVLSQAEEELRKSKLLLEKTFASLHDAVFIVDARSGKIIDCNPAVFKIFGYRQEEMLDQGMNSLYVDEQKMNELKRYMDPAIQEKGYLSIPEFEMKQRDGSVFPAEHIVIPFEDKQYQRIGWVHVIRDITERKKTEAEMLKSQKIESLGILAGGIAHDFNNLLTSILGNVSLVKYFMNPSGETSEILGEIEKVTLKARDLTRQLLTFSKGGEPIKKTTSLVTVTKDSVSFALRGAKVKCTFSVPDDILPVYIDEGQMNQVINNLIINADQAMPGGGVIEVSFKNISIANGHELPLAKGDYVKVSIHDHGIGIPRENLTKIFDPYFTTKPNGNGLGLATAYSIVKKHDGHITVESEVGIGTTFSLFIPSSKDTLEHDKEGKKISLDGTGRILIMDDDEAVRKSTGLMLERIGYEVSYAIDGTEALDLYKESIVRGNPFHIVIMDLTIPGGMGGKETVKKLLAINPQVKAIVSSGYSDDPVMADYQAYGFKGVIIKPYSIEELSALVAKLMHAAE
ncbi:MAG: PAS domain S-box protein, partial [Thermodesulfovibrionales bacterium]|nr:PAS domain S-box protein [Thermodesulfovibrionales bacterium]